MRVKILSLLAAVALLGACESATQDAGAGAGAGGAKPAGQVGPKAGSAEDFVVNVGDRVYFDFDKYNLKPDSQKTLQAQAAWLRKYPNVTVTVEGHCDERGTREYNLALGERRANATKEFLMASGVSANRIKTFSYGKERPVALGHNETAWAQNRRAVTVVTGGAGS